MAAINGVWLDQKATLRGIVKAVQALSKSNKTMRQVCLHLLRPEYNRKSASAALVLSFLCGTEYHVIICYGTNLTHLHIDITCIQSAKPKKEHMAVTAPKPEPAPATPDAKETIPPKAETTTPTPDDKEATPPTPDDREATPPTPGDRESTPPTPDDKETTQKTEDIETKAEAGGGNDEPPVQLPELPELPETVYSETELRDMRRQVKDLRNYVLGYERAMKETAKHYKSELIALMEKMTK